MLTQKEVNEKRAMLEHQFDIEAELEANAITKRNKIAPQWKKVGGRRTVTLNRDIN